MLELSDMEGDGLMGATVEEPQECGSDVIALRLEHLVGKSLMLDVEFNWQVEVLECGEGGQFQAASLSVELYLSSEVQRFGWQATF